MTQAEVLAQALTEARLLAGSVNLLQTGLYRLRGAALKARLVPVDVVLQEAWDALEQAQYLLEEAREPGWLKAHGMEPGSADEENKDPDLGPPPARVRNP